MISEFQNLKGPDLKYLNRGIIALNAGLIPGSKDPKGPNSLLKEMGWRKQKVLKNFLQATTGGGGWPMSVWLTPDLKPIVGGTYFPPDDVYYGRPGFPGVLKQIAQKVNILPK